MQRSDQRRLYIFALQWGILINIYKTFKTQDIAQNNSIGYYNFWKVLIH